MIIKIKAFNPHDKPVVIFRKVCLGSLIQIHLTPQKPPSPRSTTRIPVQKRDSTDSKSLLSTASASRVPIQQESTATASLSPKLIWKGRWPNSWGQLHAMITARTKPQHLPPVYVGDSKDYQSYYVERLLDKRVRRRCRGDKTEYLVR